MFESHYKFKFSQEINYSCYFRKRKYFKLKFIFFEFKGNNNKAFMMETKFRTIKTEFNEFELVR